MMLPALFPTARYRWAFTALLIISFALRAVLVLRGGQFYFPDELRYLHSIEIAQLIARGDVASAINGIINQPEPTGFILIGLIPAIIQSSINGLVAQQPTDNIWIPSLMLSLISITSIALTATIAQRAGATERESFIAAVLMASATSMLYYSRHLVPYDFSLALALYILAMALKQRPGFLHAILYGLLGGIAFFTYYGYWILIGLILLITLVWMIPTWGNLIRRGISMSVGFALCPVVMITISILHGASPFIFDVIDFTGNVNQGTMSEGWSLPWEYLWNAERAFVLVGVTSTLIITALAIQQRKTLATRGWLWLGIIVTIYSLLVLGSAVLGKFVVYGRLVRQMVPFFCLATAFVLEHFSSRWQAQRLFVTSAIILLVAQVALNFAPPFAQQYPADIERTVLAQYGKATRALTVKGPPVFGQDPAANPRYVLINAQYLYPVSGTRKLPNGKSILQANHPLQYLPYQFEGLDQGERGIIQSVDLTMRLIDTGAK